MFFNFRLWYRPDTRLVCTHRSGVKFRLWLPYKQSRIRVRIPLPPLNISINILHFWLWMKTVVIYQNPYTIADIYLIIYRGSPINRKTNLFIKRMMSIKMKGVQKEELPFVSLKQLIYKNIGRVRLLRKKRTIYKYAQSPNGTNRVWFRKESKKINRLYTFINTLCCKT